MPPRRPRPRPGAVRPARQAGQSSVELVAVVPALVLLAVAAGWIAATAALWLGAGSAARAGARAAAVGDDARAVVRRALPDPGPVIEVRGRGGPVATVRVEVRAPGPWGLGAVRLPVEAEAAAP